VARIQRAASVQKVIIESRARPFVPKAGVWPRAFSDKHRAALIF
jgi:hypothetical protein